MFRFAAAIFLLAFSPPALATEAGWALLREGGHAVLLRHAMAPGSGDSAKVVLDDCGTQRNLSDRGRQQAERIGALFAARAAKTDRVLSSRFCRALETARLAFGNDKVEPFEALDHTAPDDPLAPSRAKAVLAEVAAYAGSGNLIMVTHAETIAALTGVSAREGEAVIVQLDGDKLHVLGRVLLN